MRHCWLISLLLLLALPLKASEQELSVELSWGTLRGTFWQPDEASDTALILVAGSGPTDRYGNSPAGIRTQAYALLAKELTEAGYAVLSYDKRGIGASYYLRPEELLTDCHFGYFADDLERWVEELQQRGYRRIFLVGHSEGALLAKIVATRRSDIQGVVSLCGAAFPIDEILKVQLTPQLLAIDYNLYASACRIIDTLKQGETPTAIPASLNSLFPTYLNEFYHEWMSYDPRRLAGELKSPLLIVGGERDTQVSPANARALKEAQPSAQLVIFESMTHTLKSSEGRTTQEQLDAYTNPSTPLCEGLTQAIIDFLKRS